MISDKSRRMSENQTSVCFCVLYKIKVTGKICLQTGNTNRNKTRSGKVDSIMSKKKHSALGVAVAAAAGAAVLASKNRKEKEN